MNGFANHGLDEDAFGEKGNIVRAFDAFRKCFELTWMLPGPMLCSIDAYTPQLHSHKTSLLISL
jgi:hypothetical protein